MKSARSGRGRLVLLERSTILDEVDTPATARIASYLGIAIVIAFVVWASIAVMEEVAQAPGAIGNELEEARVQHPTGGVVAEMRVKEGAEVKAGQVILTLDPVETDSTLAQNKAQLTSLTAQAVRLRALLAGTKPDFRGAGIADRVIVADQERLWSVEMDSRAAQEKVLVLQEAQKRSELEALDASAAGLKRQMGLATEAQTMRQELADKGFAPKTETISGSRDVMGLQAELDRIPTDRKRIEAELSELGARRQEAISERVKAYSDELAIVNDRIAQIDESSRRIQHGARSLEVVSPLDGYIHGLVITGAGQVIRPGETIAQVIPRERSRSAELRVATKDIGSIRAGMPVRLKVSAWPFDRYGGFRGEVEAISASTFIGADGAPYYRVGVKLLGREIQGREELELIPGMTLTAEIITGERTLLQYIVKPIFASAREAFHER